MGVGQTGYSTQNGPKKNATVTLFNPHLSSQVPGLTGGNRPSGVFFSRNLAKTRCLKRPKWQARLVAGFGVVFVQGYGDPKMEVPMFTMDPHMARHCSTKPILGVNDFEPIKV